MDTWADSIRLMIEQDNRTVEAIEYLIDWSQANSFWKSNILSTKNCVKRRQRLSAKSKLIKQKRIRLIQHRLILEDKGVQRLFLNGSKP